MPQPRKSVGPPLVSARIVLVASIFALLSVSLLGVGFAGIYALSGVRGYVLGEGLWSKAQKQAVIALHRYATTGDERFPRVFQEAVDVTLGDRQAREELERSDPDMDVVREGFRRGGIPEASIEPMARLFRWGRDVGFVARTIEIWAQADALIEELIQVAGELRVELQTPDPASPRFHELMARIGELDDELTRLEHDFSRTFNEGASQVERALFLVLGLLILLLTGAGLLGGWFFFRQIRTREDALKASERRYRELFERNVVGVILASAEGRILETNHAFAAVMGHDDPRELDGRSLTDVLPSWSWEDGLPRGEMETTRSDGRPVRLLVSSATVAPEGSEGHRTLVTAMDVTEERRTRHRLAAVMDTVEEGIMSLARDGMIRFANPAARRIMDMDAHDVPRWHDEDEAIWTVRAPNGEPIPPSEYPAARVFQTGEPVRDVEVELERADGRRIPLLVNAAPLAGGREDQEEVVISFRDVTEQRTAAQALARSEERYRTVMGRIQQVIFQTDRELRWTFLNPAWTEITGYSIDETVGSDLGSWFLANDRTQIQEKLEGVIEDVEEMCRLEARVRTRDGSFRWIELLARGSRNSHGDTVGTAGTLTDVTERRELEHRLARSQRMEAMGQLAGGVAHDFNNLLTVILGNAQLLEADLGDRPGATEEMEIAVAEIQRTSEAAARLTRQLLTFSRSQILQHRELDLNEVVRDARSLTARLLPTSIECALELEPTLPPVRMSPTHLEQVLLNMIINARDAMEAGGHLTLRTGMTRVEGPVMQSRLGLPPGRYLTLEVEDTGHGMDSHVMARIFEPFFTTKGHERGTGMGLATVYGVVTQIGGAIDVHSVPGSGTTFIVYLPPAEPSPSAGPGPG